MFLLRHNFRYPGQSAWTPAHLRDLSKIKMPFPAQQFALQELMKLISEAGERLERYNAQSEREVAGWRWEPAVRALMSLRGLGLLNAATLIAEPGDLQRFERPQELMSAAFAPVTGGDADLFVRVVTVSEASGVCPLAR